MKNQSIGKMENIVISGIQHFQNYNVLNGNGISCIVPLDVDISDVMIGDRVIILYAANNGAVTLVLKYDGYFGA